MISPLQIVISMSASTDFNLTRISDAKDPVTKKRKTKYSRNGCQNCKRMKVKVSIDINEDVQKDNRNINMI